MLGLLYRSSINHHPTIWERIIAHQFAWGTISWTDQYQSRNRPRLKQLSWIEGQPLILLSHCGLQLQLLERVSFDHPKHCFDTKLRILNISKYFDTNSANFRSFLTFFNNAWLPSLSSQFMICNVRGKISSHVTTSKQRAPTMWLYLEKNAALSDSWVRLKLEPSFILNIRRCLYGYRKTLYNPQKP